MESDGETLGFGTEIELGPGDRDRLGLGDEERLRVIHGGGRMLLLERTAADPEGALPWDRDLVLHADVRAFPLADVLRMLHDAGKSGYLLFEDGDVEKSVYLNRGEVVFATSNQPIDRIGESLLRAGMIELSQLLEAEDRWSPGVRLGKILVERGFVSPRELWIGVKLQVEDIVRSLFTHTSGVVHFWEGSVQPDNVVRLSLPTRRLVAEGLKRRDELLRFVAQLEAPHVRVECVDDEAARQRKGNERLLLDAVQTATGFPEICRRSGLDPLTAARAVQLLCLIGAVRVADGGAGAANASAEDQGQRIQELVLDHLKLLSELTAPLVALEGHEAIQERFARVLEDGATRFGELLDGLAITSGGVPDPEELVARALRLPADRERAVGLALGELVSYAEFELKNSPHIDEPDRFLDAVEPLRAKLDLAG